MGLMVICGKCGKINEIKDSGADVLIDFKQKQISFICQNKDCKHDNVFDFNDWEQKSKSSPLPGIRLM